MQLIETICFEEGLFHRVNFHNERLNRSRRDLFGSQDEIRIEEFLQIPEELSLKKVKCRVLYSDKIERIEYKQYTIREIHSLKMVEGSHITYAYKYADRNSLNGLLGSKGTADEVLIIKNGFVTDTSYSNVVFRKNGQWFTPVHPILRGTRREYYLSSGEIQTTLIRPQDLKEFSEARLINSMISLEESSVIPVENIKW